VVNAALKARQRPPLDFLPQVFSADARLVLTFPLLDPYRSQRAQPVNGPILEQAPVPAAPQARTIFCYFSRGYPLHRDIPRVLQAHAGRLDIHAPELPDAEANTLQKAGASIAAEPVPAARALPSAALVLHFGGSGLASEALAAGVPQLILSMQVEQDLNGSALQDAGLGRLVRAWDSASRLGATLLDDLLQDAGLIQRAAEAGREHRAWLAAADAGAAFERVCRELLCV
jgi:UDP:flavonoid glycosyltransferase YjiC (YdhE family)